MIRALITGLALVLSIYPAMVRADVELLVGNVNGTRGSTVPVPIQLTSTGNLVAVQFDLFVLSPFLLWGNPCNGPLTNGPTALSAQLTNGARRVEIFSRTDTALANGTLVSVPLTIATNAPDGNFNVFIGDVIAAFADGTGPPLIFLGEGGLTVAPAEPARLGSIMRSGDGNRTLAVTGTINAVYQMQASTNLVNWMILDSQVASGGQFLFPDLVSTNFPSRFYRAMAP